MTIIEAVENLRKVWAKHLQAIDAELRITERVQKLIRKTYKYEWETPPKFEPPTVNTTCVSVIGALLEEVPKQTDCPWK